MKTENKFLAIKVKEANIKKMIAYLKKQKEKK